MHSQSPASPGTRLTLGLLAAITAASLILVTPTIYADEQAIEDERPLVEAPQPRTALTERCEGLPWAANVSARDPLVFTYYYYWYTDESLSDPALAQYPPAGQSFSWWDAGWHARQLEDMRAAGVDVALPVFWGTDLEWSTVGLDTMIHAREEILLAGGSPPALGLFLDTNFLAQILIERPELSDLSSDEGIDFMADQVADFYARVPPCHLITVDGRPVLFIWRPDTEDGGRFTYAGDVLTTLEARLEERLGVKPLIVRERTWDARARELDVTLDPGPVFAWGSALDGPLIEQQTVAVGPGYDDRHLPGRIGYVREREDGWTFERDLRVATLSGAPWLLLETWNEQWESTAIAETANLGRRYIEIARAQVDLFHALNPEQPRDAWADLGTGTANYLQLLATAPEERGTQVEHQGKWGSRPLVDPEDGGGYFHFALPPRMRPNGLRTATVDVEYLDMGNGLFRLQYESSPDLETDEVYTESEPVHLTNSGEWKQARFTLPDVDFQQVQYGGYGDFRIQDIPADGELTHIFARVILSSDRSPHPVALAPETLTYAPSTTAFQWTPVGGASSYRVEVTSPGAPSSHQSFITDGQSCSSMSAPSLLDQLWDGRARCATRDVTGLSAGLYQWRVEALDTDGGVLGTPSDWSYLIRR